MKRLSRCVAFFDVLGLRENLSSGDAAIAERKLQTLVQITLRALARSIHEW